MGFATTFGDFIVTRFVSGILGSAVSTSALAMLADLTEDRKERVRAVARLPMVAFCGKLGPLAADSIRRLSKGRQRDVFARYPELSGQIACASLVFMIGPAETLLLEGTLPTCQGVVSRDEAHGDCEKAAFWNQILPSESEASLDITIFEAMNEDDVPWGPSCINIRQVLIAPSVLTLLPSYSALLLRTSTSDLLLPLISHTASHEGGVGMSCAWLEIVSLLVTFAAAVLILRVVSNRVSERGPLSAYRTLTLVFPALHVLMPLVGLRLAIAGAPLLVSVIASSIGTLMKAILGEAAQVLVLLLTTSAAPDAQSTGTVIGILSIAKIFKALTVGISGMSYYVSDSHSAIIVNGVFWTALTVVALTVAAIAKKLRETPQVGTDVPETCLAWQSFFDADSEGEELEL